MAHPARKKRGPAKWHATIAHSVAFRKAAERAKVTKGITYTSSASLVYETTEDRRR